MPPILLYHDVAKASAAGGTPRAASRYRLEPEVFEDHLDAVHATGATVGLVESGETLPDVAFSFDDGESSALSVAATLERRGWRGHFFITTGMLGRSGFVDADEVRELDRRGHVVGSHSHSHPTYMGKLPRDALTREWTESRHVLGELLGHPPAVAALPGGFYTRAVAQCAEQAGYRVLMTSEPVASPRRVGALLVMGRYAMYARTPAPEVASLVRGEWAPRGRTWLAWNAKKSVKRASPRVFELGRGVVQGRR